MSLRFASVHYTTLRYTPLRYTTLHYTTLHNTTATTTQLHSTILHYTPLHYITLYYTTLQYTTLHYITLHFTTLHERSTLDRSRRKIGKRIGTRLSALHSTFHFGRKSRRIVLFLMLSSSKITETQCNWQTENLHSHLLRLNKVVSPFQNMVI